MIHSAQAPHLPQYIYQGEARFPLAVRATALMSTALYVLWPKFILIPGLGLNAFIAIQLLLLGMFAVYASSILARRATLIFDKNIACLFLGVLAFELISIGFGGDDVSWRSYFRQLIGIKAMFIVGLVIGADAKTRNSSALVLTLIFLVSFFIAVYEQYTRQSALAFAANIFSVDTNAVIDRMVAIKVRDGNFRSTGLFDHPIVLSVASSVAIGFAASIALSRIGVHRNLGWILLVFAVAAGYFSYSRTFLVGALVAITAYVAFNQLQAARRGQWILVAGGGLALIAATIFALPTVLDLVQGRTGLESQSSALRDIMWQKGVVYIAERPLLGWGWGSDVVYAGLKIGDIVTIDDSYLSMMINNGIVGVALFLAFCAACLLKGSAIITGASMHSSGHAIFACCTILVVLACQKSNSIPFAFGFLYLAAGYLAAMGVRPQSRGVNR